MQKRLQDLVKSLSEKHNLPIFVIEAIIETPFKFAAEVMEAGLKEEGVYLNTRILGFGIFHVMQGRVYNVKKNIASARGDEVKTFIMDKVKQGGLKKEIEKTLLSKRATKKNLKRKK